MKGEPAFPTPPVRVRDDAIDWGAPGMSIRDWFAGMALQAVDVQGYVSPVAAEHLARTAYNIADAMLAEREKTRS